MNTNSEVTGQRSETCQPTATSHKRQPNVKSRLDIDRVAVAEGSRGFQPTVLSGDRRMSRSDTDTGVRPRTMESPGNRPHAVGFLRRYATRNTHAFHPWVETHGYHPGPLRGRMSSHMNAKLALMGQRPGLACVAPLGASTSKCGITTNQRDSHPVFPC